mmetsp:Transcript_13574/g.43343  ORF Transcript_13574/g.43343 Transcript_13574/m.43343 type:complete len:242 (+) Transcript_13574:2271-2996(+)
MLSGDSWPPSFACLRDTVSWMRLASSSSVAPWRMASRRDDSSEPNKQALIFPSAVSRIRLHVPQKWSDMELIKPTVPRNPGTCQVLETVFAESSARARSNPGKPPSRIRLTISKYGSIEREFQRLPSKGMYSMKRTSRWRCSVSRTKSRISSSLTPRLTTQFTLTRSRPGSSAARWIEAKTCSNPRRRVMSSNLAGTMVSKLMLSKLTPASTRGSSLRLSRIPLVVIARSRMPSALIRPAS